MHSSCWFAASVAGFLHTQTKSIFITLLSPILLMMLQLGSLIASVAGCVCKYIFVSSLPQDWLRTSEEKQSKQSPKEKPVLLVQDIGEKFQSLDRYKTKMHVEKTSFLK